MSTDAPKLWRRSVFACATETTTGTAVALAAANGVFNAFNAIVDEESAQEERTGQTAFSPLAAIPNAQGGSCSLTTELFGSGTGATAPSWANTLLASCGFSITGGVATPLTAQAQTLTMGVYRDGRLKQIAGAQGGVTLNLAYGKSGKANWKFAGKWVAPSDVANIAPTFPTTIPPKFVSASLTVGGAALRVEEVDINVENQLTLRPDINDATGYHAAYIVNRKITVSMDPEAVALSTYNPFTNRDTVVAAALSVVLGTVSGNQLTITAPNMFLLPPPKDKNRGDLYADALQFLCARSSAAGDDELSISFT